MSGDSTPNEASAALQPPNLNSSTPPSAPPIPAPPQTNEQQQGSDATELALLNLLDSKPELLLEPTTDETEKDLEEARTLAAELVASGKFPEGTGAETIILAEKGLIPEDDKEGIRYYGWVVAFGVFLATLMVVGLPSAWGVYQRQFYYDGLFNGASNMQIAFVGALEPGMQMVFAPIAGRIGDALGPRYAVMMGAFLMGGGIILSSFGTQLWHLYLSYGVLAGIGASLAWIPAAATTPKWFVKRRGLAVGIGASGGGFGGLMLGPVGQALLSSLGWQWALRVTGLIGFVVIMLAALLIKLPPGMTLASIRALRKGKPFIDTHLFKSGSFNRLFGIGFLISFTYFLPFHFMAEYAYEYGWSAATGAMLIAVMNAMAGTGRLLIGLTSDYLGIFNLMCMTLLVPSVSIFLLWPWSGPYLGLMIVFSIFFGFFSGGYITLLPVATAHRFGPATLATVLGMLNLAWAPGFLFGSPIAGAIVDAHTTKNAAGEVEHVDWIPVMMYGAVLYLLCFALAMWERLKESKVLLKKC